MVFRILVLAIFLNVTTAIAEEIKCSYNGHDYPEGTRIGVVVCKDGKWTVTP